MARLDNNLIEPSTIHTIHALGGYNARDMENSTRFITQANTRTK